MFLVIWTKRDPHLRVVGGEDFQHPNCKFSITLKFWSCNCFKHPDFLIDGLWSCLSSFPSPLNPKQETAQHPHPQSHSPLAPQGSSPSVSVAPTWVVDCVTVPWLLCRPSHRSHRGGSWCMPELMAFRAPRGEGKPRQDEILTSQEP